jgi:hypothetical protein
MFAADAGTTAETEETETKFDVSGSKTAAPTELDSKHRETTVTLSLPSAEYQNKIDIVFVMDQSTSIGNAGLDLAVDATN